ncbi:unnamed protein product [Diamesa hyperborea]
MASPLPLLAILILYMIFVFNVGPKMMANRKPMNLKWIIAIYNVCQIVACSMLVIKGYEIEFTFSKHTWSCIKEPLENHRMTMYFWSWFAIFVRLIELVETVFFILRKKTNQISRLHVYHHVSTVLFFWAFVKYNAGFMEVYLAILNSGIHVIMYSYYLLTSFKVWEKYLKMFKPILTSMQLIQFIIILGHCTAAVLPGCRASPIFYGMFVNVVLLFILFGNFFIKNYLKSKKVQ